jgi:DNA-binding protein WhiA
MLDMRLHPANVARRDAAIARAIPAIRQALANADRPGVDPAPPKLRQVAQLRVDNPEASLVELGQMMTPPITKHAVAGRLRRFLHYYGGQRVFISTRAADPREG